MNKSALLKVDKLWQFVSLLYVFCSTCHTGCIFNRL